MKKITKNSPFSDDVRTRRIFNIGTYAVLGLVSLVMTIMNLYTHKGYLTYCTGAFVIFCLVNIALSFINPVLESVAKALFSVEVVLLFTFFLVSGNPEGFSAIWICMLPSLGMFFFDRLRGTILCGFMFAILVFFLWTPFGNSLLSYNYTDSFKLRFPVLFIAFHFLAFFLETLRANSDKKLRKMQEYYKDLSSRDPLTNLYNRQGMYSEIESKSTFKTYSLMGVVMLDLDRFKAINDTYGHNTGDAVLRTVANIVKEKLNATVCRWGGEEFVAIFSKNDVTYDDLESLKNEIQQYEFSSDNKIFSLTVSIGVCMDEASAREIDTLIENADIALYEAKNSGRNKIVYYKK